MGSIQRYHAADLPQLMDRITKNSIGLDNFFESFFDQDVTTNYPPYNLIHVNNVESRLEIALAGFKKNEVKVYTEYGKLFVTAEKPEKEERDYDNNEKIIELYNIIKSCGGIDYSKKIMKEYHDKAIGILNEFEDNEAKNSLMLLLKFIINRKK